MLFIGNSATEGGAWVPTNDDHMSSEAPIANDVDLESRTDFLESLDTTIVSDPTDGVEELKQARKRQKKKAPGKTPT